MDDADRSSFPELAPRFEKAEAEIQPDFARLERTALVAQARHRRYRLALIVGGALTAVFGAVQSGVTDARWPGVVVALVSATTAWIAAMYRNSGSFAEYVSTRATAEQLRSLYFRALMDPATDHPRPVERAVADALYGERTGEA